MACEQYTLGARVLSIAPSPPSSVLSLSAVNAQLLAASGGGVDCATLADIINPAFTDATNSAVVLDGTIISFADMTFSVLPVPGGGTITLNIDGVDYGFWTCTDSGSGVVVEDHTTYGPTVTMGPVSNVLFGQNVGACDFALPVPVAIINFDAVAYIECAVPACGISPPGPPFPPYLPPSIPWPTITPGPLPPTPTFQPGQFPNMVLAFGANYSVFSNFGFKG